MTFGRHLALVIVVCIVSWGSASCGNEKGKAPREKPAAQKTVKSAPSIGDLARQASAALSIEDEFIEGRRVVEAAGFVVKSYKEFPAQEVAKKGRMLVYTDKRKGRGGVVYVKKTGAEVAPAWHWYFEGSAPDSVVKCEINRDGLWDVRIAFPHGKVEEYLQEDSFTLFAKERSDWIAMNGTSSPLSSQEFPMWLCFDGDTTTAWRSSVVGGGAFLEFAVPFGVQEGLLTIATPSKGQPERCIVYADGKRVEEVAIRPVAGRQVIALGAGVKGATKIRLEFPSVRGDTEVVAVAEVGLK